MEGPGGRKHEEAGGRREWERDKGYKYIVSKNVKLEIKYLN